MSRLARRLVLAAVFFGSTALRGASDPNKATFLGHTTFFGEPYVSTSPSYTYAFFNGTLHVEYPSDPINEDKIDGFTMNFASPQAFSLDATYEYDAPMEMPPKTHTVQMQLRLLDDAHPDRVFCSSKGDLQTVMSGASVSVSAALPSCTLTTWGYFNQTDDHGTLKSLSGVDSELTVFIDGVGHANTVLYSFWRNEDIQDTLYLVYDGLVPPVVSFIPPMGVRLTPGSTQGFSGNVRATLRSKDSATLDFRVTDQQGVLQGAMSPVTVTKGVDQAIPVSIAPFTIDPGATRLDLKTTMTDRATSLVLAAADVVPYPVGDDCNLTGRLFRTARGRTNPLPGADVELWDVSGSAERMVDKVQAKLKGSFDLPDATYCFKLPAGFDTTHKYQLRVRLRDSLDEAGAKILISGSLNDGPTPFELRWKATTLQPGGTNRKDLEVDAAKDLDVPADKVNTAYAAAETYWHLWRQVYIMMPVATSVPLSRDLPLEVYLNGTTTTHYCETNAANDCLTPSSIVLETVDSVPNANPSVVWHEFGHHLIRELYAGAIPRPGTSTLDVNHDGYANDYTSASIDEGFATFWSVSSSRALDFGSTKFRWNTPTPANSTALDIDLNYRATQQAGGPNSNLWEELAVAGLLWDLTDATADAGDTITKPLSDVLSVFQTSRPSSMLKLYGALKAKFPDTATAPPGKSSALDDLFVVHGFFADQNGDFEYQPGEEVGRAANSAPWNGSLYDGTSRSIPPRPGRERLPQVRGALVDVTFVDESGARLPGADVALKIEYGPGFTSLNSQETLSATEGQIYLQMPPPHYPATATLYVPDSPGGAFVIDAATYWRTAGTTSTLGAQTFVVPSSPAIDAFDKTSGTSGDVVVLSGRNFGATPAENAVSFGGTAAAITDASTTRLAVVVPEGLPAGPVDVTVTVKERTSNAKSFTVTAPLSDVSPTSFDFGTVLAGTTADRTVTVRNAGTAPLTVRGAASTNPRFRVVSPALPFVLAPAATQSLTIRFSPTASGSQAGSLYVATDDPRRRAAAVSLAGAGIAPKLSFMPDAFDFGGVAVSTTATATFVLKNSGDAPFTLSVPPPVQGGPFLYSVPIPFTLPPGGSIDVTVRFTPRAAGKVSGGFAFGASFLLRGEGVSGGGAGETLSTDDGTVEAGAVGDGLAIVNRFTPTSYPEKLTTIRIYEVAFQGLPSPAGASIRLVAFADPSGSGASPQRNPTLLVDQTVTLPALPSGGGGFVDFSLANGPTVSSGDLYVGYVAPSPAGGVGFAADSSGAQKQRGFFSTDGGATFVGPLVLQGSGAQTPVNIMIRAVLAPASAASSCTYAVTNGTPSVPAGGGSGTVSVAAPAGCVWSASSGSSWLSVSPSSGSGNGSTTFTAAANPAAARNGSLAVAGFSLPVVQAGSEAPAEERTLVPIVLASAGAAGSYFTSELTLTNRGTTDAVAEMTYTAALGSGSGTGYDVIPAGAQVTLPDAISYLTAAGVPIPASGNRGGTLGIHLLGVSSPAAVSATVRTTSLVPEGRAGLAYGDVPAASAFTEPVTLCGLRQNAQDRSNVALINAGAAGQDVTLRLTVVSGDANAPIRVTLPDVSLPPGGFTQLSGILASNGLSLANGYVRVERVAGTAPFYAYAVINDQKNSDGSFVPPLAESTLAGRASLTLPVVVETADFSTELVATNFGTAPKTVRLTFVADAVQASGNAATFTLTVRPAEQLLIPGLVQYLRDHGVAGVGSGTFAGALFATVDGGDVSGLFLGARTSAAGGGGRYGLFYAAVPQGRAASRTAWIFGLQQTADTRSNLALVNTGETDGSTDVFRLEIFDGKTARLVRTVDGVSLGPKRWTQMTTVLSQFAPGTTNGYVKVTKAEGSNPFLVYGVVNDGGAPGRRTGDGAFVPMSAVDE